MIPRPCIIIRKGGVPSPPPSHNFIYKFEPNFMKFSFSVLWSDVRYWVGSGFQFQNWGGGLYLQKNSRILENSKKIKNSKSLFS